MCNTGEPPLDEIQPVFTKDGVTYHSATLLHRLAGDGSVSTLVSRFSELTADIVNNTKCWREWTDGTRQTEVRWKQLANLHPPSLIIY